VRRLLWDQMYSTPKIVAIYQKSALHFKTKADKLAFFDEHVPTKLPNTTGGLAQ
jgi:hypothetical protein